MNAVLEQINSTGKAFVEFAVPMLVQSSVLIVILLLLDFVLRKKVKAVFRYCIWMLVLLKLILPTSLSSPLSVGYWFGDHLANVTESRTSAEEVTEPEAEVLEPALAGMLHIIEPLPIEEERTAPAVLPVIPGAEWARAKPITPPAVSVTPVTWQGVVFLVWLAVVIAMGLLLLQRAMFVRGLVAQAREANDLMNGALEYCCKCMGVRRKVGLKVSANAASPAVCGLFRPVILVPHKLAPSLGSRHLRAVLLHELAHIRRGDLWVNLAQTFLQIAYFYNPLLWFANAMIRRVREQAIDETVLVAMGEKAQQYPQTLVNVAKLAFKRPVLSLRLIGVVESKSALAGRIKHILSRPMPKSAKVGVLGLAAVLIIGAILLPMAKAAQFTDHTRQIMKLARQEARQLNHEYIGTEHILLALVKEGRGVSGIVLRKHDVNIEKVRLEVGKLVRSGPKVVARKKLPKTARAKRAMKYAKEEAKVSGHDYVGAEHVLLGLLREKDGVAAQILMKLGLTIDGVRREVSKVVGPKPKRGGYPTLVISGVVTDAATGNPIAGARVGDNGYGRKPYRGAVTDSNGRYYYLTWPERHSIKVEARGYKTQRKTLYEGHLVFDKEMVEEEIHFTLEPEQTPRPHFSATLPNGVTVELVGVTNHYIQSERPAKQIWWGPSGKILEKMPYTKLGLSATTDYRNLNYEFAIRLDGRGENTYAAETSLGRSLGFPKVPKSKTNESLPNMRAFIGEFRKEDKEGNIRFGVAAGGWQEVEVWRDGWTGGEAYNVSTHSESSVVYEWPRQDGNKVVIEVTHTLANEDRRLLIVDKDGKIHIGDGRKFVGEGAGIVRDIYYFHNFNRKDMKVLKFEKRPYEWVEFENISLQPSVKTDVKVEGEVAWGEAVEGVQVRLRADKVTWDAGEKPTFKADVRNGGERHLQLPESPDWCLVQVDGRWFFITGYEPGKEVSLSTRVLDFLPGQQRTGIPLELSDKWETMLDSEVALGAYVRHDGIVTGPGLRSRLKLTPGKHTIHVSFILGATRRGVGLHPPAPRGLRLRGLRRLRHNSFHLAR
jgi:beta-lactamase regulating signal transducer with metallopeptidase domain